LGICFPEGVGLCPQGDRWIGCNEILLGKYFSCGFENFSAGGFPDSLWPYFTGMWDLARRGLWNALAGFRVASDLQVYPGRALDVSTQPMVYRWALMHPVTGTGTNRGLQATRFITGGQSVA